MCQEQPRDGKHKWKHEYVARNTGEQRERFGSGFGVGRERHYINRNDQDQRDDREIQAVAAPDRSLNARLRRADARSDSLHDRDHREEQHDEP